MSSGSSVNLELLQELLEFEPRRADGCPVDLADPPRDDDGKLICGRECLKAGGPCRTPVRIPFVCCDRHEPLDPIVAAPIARP